MMSDMKDSNLSCKISNTDLAALESKYHFKCLIAYRNKHWSLMRSNSRNENVT